MKTSLKNLLDILDKNSKLDIDNILKQYLPKTVISRLMEFSDITPNKKASQITKLERKNILKFLKSTTLTVEKTEPDGEIVTAGGVELNEINSKTMESKLVKDLYFCGEILNVDGLTGGFNLQACWSTGYIAGLNASKKRHCEP